MVVHLLVKWNIPLVKIALEATSYQPVGPSTSYVPQTQSRIFRSGHQQYRRELKKREFRFQQELDATLAGVTAEHEKHYED